MLDKQSSVEGSDHTCAHSRWPLLLAGGLDFAEGLAMRFTGKGRPGRTQSALLIESPSCTMELCVSAACSMLHGRSLRRTSGVRAAYGSAPLTWTTPMSHSGSRYVMLCVVLSCCHVVRQTVLLCLRVTFWADVHVACLLASCSTVCWTKDRRHGMFGLPCAVCRNEEASNIRLSLVRLTITRMHGKGGADTHTLCHQHCVLRIVCCCI